MADKAQTGMSDASVRAFGLGHSGLTVSTEPVEKPTEAEASESDEGASPDASTEETASTEDSTDESKDAKGENADEKKADPKVDDAEKRAKEAEQRERKLQSRLDKQTALYERQVREIQEQFERFKATVQSRTVDDGLKPDDLVDKKTVERLVREAMAQTTPQKTNGAAGPTYEQQRHIQAHPDYEDVQSYWEKIKDSDNDIATVPTDLVGAFYAIQTKRLMEQMEEMKKSQKAEIEKAVAAERKKFGERPKVPPTGGSGNRRDTGGERVVEEMTATEKMFANFFDKRAGGKTKVVQVSRR